MVTVIEAELHEAVEAKEVSFGLEVGLKPGVQEAAAVGSGFSPRSLTALVIINLPGEALASLDV